ncbi:MAG: succinyldiaminopimelate transaminase [Actinobacteria bacterium]|nr:succinyldiaminopimelate transaminase [Actinomycetota bacterium]MBI3687993.1 succinyldiaminopimelate transaminase [Actinomycetota bacterium]
MAGWADRLPAFPWDTLARHAEVARGYRDGIVDLSMGTPVDPVPDVIRSALANRTDTPGYPAVHGTEAVRAAAAAWLARRFAVRVTGDAVLPTIGSKELVALLPLLLGAGPGQRVLHPRLAYPTYEVGARLAGCVPVAVDGPPDDPDGVALVWLNSPSNPTGRVLGVAELREWVAWGRRHGVPVVSDECYLEFGWEVDPVSVLHPSVCDGTPQGVLIVHSLSKRSNLAGYRAGVVTGDPALVAGLLAVRKHAGLMVPAPVQAAMAAAFADDAHVAVQRERYAARRVALGSALRRAGFRIDHSEAGLYLWASRDEDCWETVSWLAGRGILVAPGAFYGVDGARHVRVALTATDERVSAAVARLG